MGTTYTDPQASNSTKYSLKPVMSSKVMSVSFLRQMSAPTLG